jgi:hypothetical protein
MIEPFKPYLPGRKRTGTPPPEGDDKRSEPDPLMYDIHKFQIGKEFLEFYRATGDTGKVFIPAEMLEKVTLLSVDSAKALMNGDD